jgi:hypothetical protein
MYMPTLADDAFLPLPDGVELPGSPDDYRFPLYALPPFGHFESEEAAGRILLALALHGEWKAIKVSAIGTSLVKELEARRADPRGTYSHSQLIFPDGLERILRGIDELIERGLLGTDDTDGIWTVWPAPDFVERAAPYRVTQPVG